jgi:CRP-like cAMP-binding protein
MSTQFDDHMTDTVSFATPGRLNGESPAPADADPISAARDMATMVRARRRQRLTFDGAQGEVVYVLRNGLLAIEAFPPGKPRQILSLIYPGDIVRRSQLPDLPAATLTALSSSEIWRFPVATFDALVTANPPAIRHVMKKLATQQARSALHASIVGGLTGDERFASLLIELGLRLPSSGAAARIFDMPLSRADVADHLALNPDTLSRITSRFKARGLLSTTGGHVSLPDWTALCAASPIASTLQALHAPGAA